MTIYATKQDFISRFGIEELLQLCGTIGAGEPSVDDAALAVALNDASREVDGYIAVRYPLELIAVRQEFPEPLTRAVCDIARYFLYKDQPTDQVAQRYKEVTTWLVNVSKGVVILAFVPPLTGEEALELIFAPAPVVGIDQGGIFAGATLSRMPEVCPLGYLLDPFGRF